MYRTFDVKEFKHLSELKNELDSLPSRYIYRGHSCHNWELESSLERILGINYQSKAKAYEDYSLNFFERRFHLYDKSPNLPPTSKLEKLAIMQHYGFRTRMLDFTYSPYVALYFALENIFEPPKEKFAICAIDEETILKESLRYLRKEDTSITTEYDEITGHRNTLFKKIDAMSPEILWVTEPSILNLRLEMQQGCFLFSGKPGQTIKKLFSKNIYDNIKNYFYVLPCSESKEIYYLLRKMNIDGRTIYGGLEGLAKSSYLEMHVQR